MLWSSGGLKSQVVEDFGEKFAFFKNDPLRENFQNSVPKGFTNSPIHVLFANFVKFDRSEIGKVVRYLPDKIKQKFASLSRSRFCADRAQNVPGPAANNVLSVPNFIEIGLLATELPNA